MESEHNAESLVALKKRIGTVNFSREILVKPISDLSSVLPYNVMSKSFDNKITLVDSRDEHPYKDAIIGVVTGIDYAFSSSSSADYVRMYTVGILNDGRKVLVS